MQNYSLLPTEDDEVDGISQLTIGKSTVNVINGFRLSSFYGDDQITFSYSGLFRGSVRIDTDHLDAVVVL